MTDIDTSPAPAPVAGWTAFALGAVTLIAAFVVFWAGPFAPQQAVDVSLGQLAADIAKNAARAAAGIAPPAPEPVVRDLDDWLRIGVVVLAGLAIIAGVLGLVRKEPMRPALAGAGLGVFVIAFQLFATVVAMIVGALLIFAIMSALGDTFSGIFGGLGG